MQGAQGSPHHFAGVLVASTFDSGQDEIVGFRGQLDRAMRHAILLETISAHSPLRMCNHNVNFPFGKSGFLF
jgi:hypothetical protein